MQEVTLLSGNKLNIQTARFGAVQELIRCACREIKKDGLHIDLESITDGEALAIILSVAGSKEFDDCFWVVANGCLYNGERVNPSLFDDREEAREDFVEIQYKIIEASLKPFGKSLLTILKSKGILK